ncbi:Alpha/Beta hydrolase protein [Aspergillus unguis]
MTLNQSRLPVDREIASLSEQLGPAPPPSDSQSLNELRDISKQLSSRDAVMTDPNLVVSDVVIPGPRGEITLSVITSSRTNKDAKRPGVYYIHGGGMVAGDRFMNIDMVLESVTKLDAVIVTVEYRLAPEHPHPAPVEDCYAGLTWVGQNLERLNIDADRLMIFGISAGGGLAAGTVLMARDRGRPKLCAQLISCPMLDYRNDTLSSHSFADGLIWNRAKNLFGWKSLLGERMESGEVSIYASPALASDLSNLPPAYLDVGSNEVFRDEDLAYVQKLWQCGVPAEVHVWPGVPHGFEMFFPTASITKIAAQTRTAWVRRILDSRLPQIHL